jgi:trans-aconitate methyltransferase
VRGDESAVGRTWSDPKPPPTVDVSVAHPARIYDYLLGGKDNYAVDRAVGEHLQRISPLASASARRNREFVLRAVATTIREHDIDQVLDLGTGIPTAPTVHGVARAANPDARVVYVDNDPIVLAHDRALLAVEPGVHTVLGDLTDPPSVLEHPELVDVLDWSRPICVVMAAVFHFVPDAEDPLGVLAGWTERMAPGSVLIVSMLTDEDTDPDELELARTAYRASQGLTFRSRERVAAFFAGLDLVEPGIVHPAAWRPTEVPATATEGSAAFLVGVGVRR